MTTAAVDTAAVDTAAVDTAAVDTAAVDTAAAPPAAGAPLSVADALGAARDQHGATLAERSRESPLLIVFLRHQGCTFCREALAEIAAKRADIERNGTRIALVHQSSEEEGAAFFAGYGLGDVIRVSDPRRALYKAFELRKTTFAEIFTFANVLRAAQAFVTGGHGLGRPVGNVLQMPGTFLVCDSRILRAFRHKTVADRPDYVNMACELPAR